MYSSLKIFKAHSLGNDFILIEVEDLNIIDKNFVLTINNRFTGIGCNQLLVIDKNYNVKIWDEDGSNANLCGNGLRCLAKLVNKSHVIFHTDSGHVELQNLTDGKVLMNVQRSAIISDENDHYFVNIGNLHKIYFLDNHDDIDILKYRNDDINHSFLSKKNNKWHIRTMECNTTIETLACGSASLASAYVLKNIGETDLTLHYKLGSIDHEIHGDKIIQIGPATIVAELIMQ